MRRIVAMAVAVMLVLAGTPQRSFAGGELPPRLALAAARSLDVSDWPTGRELLALSPIDLLAGQSIVLAGRVTAKNESTVNATQQAGVGCDDTPNGVMRTSRNNEGIDVRYPGGKGVLSIDVRYLFTAPADGAYTCRMWAQTSSNALTALPASTYLEVSEARAGARQVLQGPCDGRGTIANTPDNPNDSECVYFVPPTVTQTGEARYPRQGYVLTEPAFVADPSAAAVEVTADLELTTCYKGTSNCLGHIDQYGGADRRSTGTVHTRLEMIQLDAEGGLANCGWRGFFPALGSGNSKDKNFLETVIAHDAHHIKIAHGLRLPVSTTEGCTRNFLIRVLVRSVAGDPVKVEGTLLTKSGGVRQAFSNLIVRNDFSS